MSYLSSRVRVLSHRAFTLVELLVVVAIIALLVSILLPSLGRAKAVTRMVMCQTNLNAIGKAAFLYASNNDDYIPRGAANNCNSPGANLGCYQFAVKFSQYVGGPVIPFEYDDDWAEQYNFFKNIPVYRCPSFQDREYVLTYVLNARNFDYPPGYKEDCTSKLEEMPRAPAEIAYICGLNPANPSLGPSGCFGSYDFWDNGSGGWYSPQLTFDRNGDPSDCPRILRYDDDRHFGRITLVFFDGHTENRKITPEEMPEELFFPEW